MREYKIRGGVVLEFRDGQEFREVSQNHQGYLAWLAEGNVAEVLDPLPAPSGPTLEELKIQYKKEIIAARDKIIQAPDMYPLQKQMNINALGAGFTQADKDKMRAEIDFIWAMAAEKVQQMESKDPIEELEQYMQTIRAEFANEIPQYLKLSDYTNASNDI